MTTPPSQTTKCVRMNFQHPNLKASGVRPKALVDELDAIKLGIYPDNSHRLPLVIAQQDLSPHQAFRGLADFHCWYSSDRPITEKDYDKIKNQVDWKSKVEEAPQALFELGALLVEAQCSLAGTHSPSFSPGLETLRLAHEAIVEVGKLKITSKTALRKALSLLEGARDYVDLTEMLISNVAPDIDRDNHTRAIEEATSRFSKLKDLLTALYDDLIPDSSTLLHSVAFYVHKSIPTTSWKIETPNDKNKGLVATLILITLTGTLSIHNVYNRNRAVDVEKLADYIATFKGDNILLGDFNLHHPLWSGEGKGNVTKDSKIFADRVQRLGLKLRTKRGEITWSNSTDTEKRSSTIDLTFASPKLCPLIESCKALSVPGFNSDHRPIQTVIRKYVEQDVRTKKCFDRADPEKFNKCLRKHLPPLDSPLATKHDVDRFFVAIIKAIQIAIEECIPTKICGSRISQKTRAATSTLRNLSETIETLKQREGSRFITEQIKKLEQEKSRLYSEIWRGFTERKSGTPKGLFGLAGLAKKMSQPIPQTQVPTLQTDTEVAHDAETKIELVKKTKFRDIYEDISTRFESLPSTPSDAKSPIPISDDLTEEELKAVIKDIKTGKATGEDEVPNEAIRLGQDVLFPYLLIGFQVCIRLRTHPDCFKKAVVVMVLKAGANPNDPNSYRPITLLSHVGKLYEKVLANKITRAVKANPNMLPPTQFGGRSTTEALLYLLNIIHNAWCSDGDKVVTILSLDMSAAYDNVLRSRLLKEMARIGLPSWIIETVASFLSYRDAKMRMPGIESDDFEMNTGIPQGSPMSSILFYIFAAPILNDLGTYLGAQRVCSDTGRERWVDLYAFAFVDDIYFVAVSDSYEINCAGIDLLHTELLKVAKELRAIFGAHKYHIMHMQSPYGKKRHDNEMPNIIGFTEPPQPKLTILGVEIDQHLNWEAHIEKILEKCNKRIVHMRRISGATWGPNLHAMRHYYLAIIRPVITYACGVWMVKPHERSGSSKWVLKNEFIGKLQSLQRDCLRLVSGCHGKTGLIVLEKELFIPDIAVVLRSQARLQRAKSFCATDKRWRTMLNSKFLRMKRLNPSVILHNEAMNLVLEATRSHVDLARQRCRGDELSPYYDALWYTSHPAKWADIASSYIKRQVTTECKAIWKGYVDSRVRAREGCGRPSKTLSPAIIDETWGRSSLEYYNGLTRAQSTMLLQCRTEFIGLAGHLFTIGKSKSPDCPCGDGRQTPFHCFVRCRNLDNFRHALYLKLGHINYKDLLTTHGKIAAQWAIAYFDIEQFDRVRAKASCFPVDPNLTRRKEDARNFLSFTTPIQQRPYSNGTLTLAPTAERYSSTPLTQKSAQDSTMPRRNARRSCRR
ncbi:hypothetical protein FIE12Z_7259 [Fusarium flagelliforme]|uniref:Reverse transcriptase domain-containing protein n=1 Tax=Fusarium flagelliforme TaxID=2675880 RepID=A0A395MMA5_9HYPO|nr:hypothetical protein FIE12Z_7259 [Fusarium flagelliforme]